MENILTLYPTDWREYELLDSGAQMKLERFGEYVIARPDPRALWRQHLSQKEWLLADATFSYTASDRGNWKIRKTPPKPWILHYKKFTFLLAVTEFKHLGVFPEQAVSWDWISEMNSRKKINVLNLFAYTGGTTLAVAAAGSKVTHVDSAKPAISWANENARLSKLERAPIRWIVDDVYKFVQRESRRGIKYDALIMDPPRFGHGISGEIWKIEKHLPELLDACKKILIPQPAYILINAYTADLSSLALRYLLEDITNHQKGILESGELALLESNGKRLLPSGIFARWKSKE